MTRRLKYLLNVKLNPEVNPELIPGLIDMPTTSAEEISNYEPSAPLTKLMARCALLSINLCMNLRMGLRMNPWIGLAIPFILLACASTPPSETLPQSKVAVSSVDHENYRKYVSSEVDAVKTKLKQAESFAAEKQHAPAEQLAQQILADVELIQIKTQRLHVEQEVTQIENNISNLNQELKWREPVPLSPLN